jgi:hypothetical protein
LLRRIHYYRRPNVADQADVPVRRLCRGQRSQRSRARRRGASSVRCSHHWPLIRSCGYCCSLNLVCSLIWSAGVLTDG